MKNIIYIKCSNNEQEYVKIFNFLNSALIQKKRIHSKDGVCSLYMYNGYDDKPQDIINAVKQKNNTTSISSCHIDDAMILIDVIIPDDDTEIDMFAYRYLVLLVNKLFRENDAVVLSCNFAYYNKIGSFLFFERVRKKPYYVFTGKDNAEPKAISLPMSISISGEWLPIMIFEANENNKTYNFLNNPLCDKNTKFEVIIDELSEIINKGHINFSGMVKSNNEPSCYLKLFFSVCTAKWIKIVNDASIIETIMQLVYQVPSLAFIMFSIQLNYIIFKQKYEHLSVDEVKKIMNICCDFSEGILQTIENTISHSEGGCFTFRVNSNFSKLHEEFTFDSQDKVFSYIRLSLVDFSNAGIIENLMNKNRFENEITLKEVFADNSSEMDEEYKEYILSENGIIHHYGLPIFSNTVSLYQGCFVVKSSSETTITTDEKCLYKNSNKEKNGFSYNGLNYFEHIPGTEYDIIFPLLYSTIVSNDKAKTTSVVFNCDFDENYNKDSVVFNENTTMFFNKTLDNIIISLQKERKYKNQELKEEAVNLAAQKLSKILLKDLQNNKIFYLVVDDNSELPYRRPEIIAKVLLKSMSLVRNQNIPINIVLYGFSTSRITAFIRQFSLFYRNNAGCKYMKNNQIYVVSADYKTEVLFIDSNLYSSFKYQNIMRFNSGISKNILDVIEHIASTRGEDEKDDSQLLPIDYDMLPRLENENGNYHLSNKKWCHDKLYSVISNDIHGEQLGCKLSHTHIRVKDVHLDTFYEAQLLFANSYWYNVFAKYLYEELQNRNELKNKTKPIILYAYETYSEPMLYLLKSKLKNIGYSNVEYIIFENEKYISTGNKSKQRIRYAETVFDKIGDSDFSVVYICGISTTLSTFYNSLHEELVRFFSTNDKLRSIDLKTIYKVGYSIIQICDPIENSIEKKYIELDEKEMKVHSKKNYLDFLDSKSCFYFVDAISRWYEKNKCPLCFPDSFVDEKLLIETNETSTVPMLLLKPQKQDKVLLRTIDDCAPKSSFLRNSNNSKYLYYCHLNRGDNHYQYYIRTANFIQDQLSNNNKELFSWFRFIKEKETISNKNTVNIIVSPSHFSNEAFVSAINQHVFEGKAYIINFDVKKEFRSSFEAKYSNYKVMFELALNDYPHFDKIVNFYFIDDNIVTGATYHRTKSLIRNFINEYNAKKSSNLKVNLFKSIIVLVNRNSRKSLISFFDNIDTNKDEIEIPVYSYIDLKTPSIRTYGDSCPNCNKVSFMNLLLKESSLEIVAEHWQNRIKYHGIKSLSDAKMNKCELENRNSEDYSYSSRGFKRLQCSEYIWGKLPQEYIDASVAKNNIKSWILEFLNSVEKDSEKIEYLISFYKTLSRPYIVYQESINSAVLQILLETYKIFLEPDYAENDQFLSLVLCLIKKSDRKSVFNLYCSIISLLCSLGSNIFIREGKLVEAYKTGNHLSSFSDNENIFNDFFLFQIKKWMFANKDYAFKVEKLNFILAEYIKNEGEVLESDQK